MLRDIGITLTGTIAPNSTFVAHSDPKTRRLEYLNAINYYKKFAPVYFLENSDYPLLDDKDFVDAGVFLRKFQPSLHFNKGKGYQEFEMIEKWLESEEYLPERFIKITGRYIIVNFQRIFNECLAERSDCLVIDQLAGRRVALSRLFYTGSGYYEKYLKGLYLDSDDAKNDWVERVLYRKIMMSGMASKIFSVEPWFCGVEGSSGMDIGTNRIKYLIKYAMRRFNYMFDKRRLYLRA